MKAPRNHNPNIPPSMQNREAYQQQRNVKKLRIQTAQKQNIRKTICRGTVVLPSMPKTPEAQVQQGRQTASTILAKGK